MPTSARPVVSALDCPWIPKPDRAVLLVPPPLLDRVVRADRGLSALTFQVPHDRNYTIERDRLSQLLEANDLPETFATLPPKVILIPRGDWSVNSSTSLQDALRHYWRRLFHARVHEAQEAVLTPNALRHRLRLLGSGELAEARLVLNQMGLLFPPFDDREVYVELAATYLELKHFDQRLLGVTFPGLRRRDEFERALDEDVHDHALLTSTCPQTDLPPVPSPDEPALPFTEETRPAQSVGETLVGLQSSVIRVVRDRAQAVRDLGNHVGAAVHLWAHGEGMQDLQTLVDGLKTALVLSDDEAAEWLAALQPLVGPAARGFRSVEARVLYDLQKLVVDHDRELSSVNFAEWVLWLGRIPLSRPLPLAKDVLLLRHLRQARHNLRDCTLPRDDCDRLDRLLETALDMAAHRLHLKVRPLIGKALDESGLKPEHAPERVARDKMIAELADRIVGHGRLSFSDVRDAVSRSQFKLPDLAGAGDLLFGDPLLRLDKRLFLQLDGVYHRAEFYFRWLQTLSSLFFGTRPGRLLTLYALMPFGGAFLLIGFVYYLVEEIGLLIGFLEKSDDDKHKGLPLDGTTAVLVLVIGLFIFGLLHWPAMRALVWDWLKRVGRGLGWLCVTLSGWTNVSRRKSDDRPVTPRRGPQYVVEALVLGIVAIVICLICRLHGWPALAVGGGVFVLAWLLLNTALGRVWGLATTQMVSKLGRVVWTEGFVRVGRLIIDLSHRVIDFVEVLCYRMDEFVRFRAREKPGWRVVKAVAALLIAPVVYLLRFVVLLLIEPQINPLKHFPVVTVGHKLLLPMIPSLAGVLMQHYPLEVAEAWVLAFWLIAGIPGIFGFIAWEMLSNWRLYAANRPEELRSVRVGSHGEHLPNLLRPGIHSGTLPKVYARLRRAEERFDTAGVRKQHERLHHVEVEVRDFVARELVAVLAMSPGWGRTELKIGRVELSTQTIGIDLVGEGLEGPLRLDFEEHSGRVLAGASAAGWPSRLSERQRSVLRAALAGWFKLAGVALVRQAPGQSPEEAADNVGVTIRWQEWTSYWDADAAAQEPAPLPAMSLVTVG